MALHHLEDLLELEARRDPLRRSADVTATTPTGALDRCRVELVELGHGGDEVDGDVAVVAAQRVLQVRALRRVAEVHGHLGVEAHQHAGGLVPEIRGEAVLRHDARDSPVGVEGDLRRLGGRLELLVAGGDELGDLGLVVGAVQDGLHPLDPLAERHAEVRRLPRDRDHLVPRPAGGRPQAIERADGADEHLVDLTASGAVGQYGHGTDRVGVAPHRGQHGPGGRELGAERLLHRARRLRRVLRTVVIEVAELAPLGEVGDRDLDPHQVAALIGVRNDAVVLVLPNGAGVELRENVGDQRAHIVPFRNQSRQPSRTLFVSPC